MNIKVGVILPKMFGYLRIAESNDFMDEMFFRKSLVGLGVATNNIIVEGDCWLDRESIEENVVMAYNKIADECPAAIFIVGDDACNKLISQGLLRDNIFHYAFAYGGRLPIGKKFFRANYSMEQIAKLWRQLFQIEPELRNTKDCKGIIFRSELNCNEVQAGLIRDYIGKRYNHLQFYDDIIYHDNDTEECILHTLSAAISLKPSVIWVVGVGKEIDKRILECIAKLQYTGFVFSTEMHNHFLAQLQHIPAKGIYFITPAIEKEIIESVYCRGCFGLFSDILNDSVRKRAASLRNSALAIDKIPIMLDEEFRRQKYFIKSDSIGRFSYDDFGELSSELHIKHTDRNGDTVQKFPLSKEDLEHDIFTISSYLQDVNLLVKSFRYDIAHRKNWDDTVKKILRRIRSEFCNGSGRVVGLIHYANQQDVIIADVDGDNTYQLGGVFNLLKLYISQVQSINDALRASSSTENVLSPFPIQINNNIDEFNDNEVFQVVLRIEQEWMLPCQFLAQYSCENDTKISIDAIGFKHGPLYVDVVCRKSCEDVLYKAIVSSILKPAAKSRSYQYIIPDFNSSSFANGAVFVESDKYLPYPDIQMISTTTHSICSPYIEYCHMQRLGVSNTKSAIGSIMSRNGSHNIGSHVLAALSHNVGTMPDDRVLYQYIQHRMDYIATATTDFPVWKQPLYLVGNLMKTFLMQRHLLDHITGSEGLRAYQFQNDRIDTTKKESQPDTICVHIRRINDADFDWGEANNFSTNQPTINFIGYPDSPPNPGAMRHDLELAIPGGIVGQHAFFTILENILRNAAKHEWAKLKNVQNDGNVVSCGESTNGKSSDGQSDSDSSNREKRPCHHLDIHIDFKDNPDAGIVEFVVWTDSEYSRQNYKVETFKNRAVRLPRKDVLARLSQDDSSGELDTNELEEHQKLQLMMARSLINNEGQLRKENWGLAEMRISAGFLNVVDIATIGGLGDRTATMDLISPTMVLFKDHYCMGYHFHVPKPRELLIVVPDNLRNQQANAITKDNLASAHAKLMKYGIGIVTEDEVGKESEKPERSDRLSYAYALFNKFDRDCMRTWKIPFRLVTIANDPLCPIMRNKLIGKPIDRRADFTGNANFFTPDSLSTWLRDILNSDDNAKKYAEKLLSDIYTSWVRHLKKERFGVDNGLKNIPIAIDLDGDNKNAGGSLISDADLLELVMGDCFSTAVSSFEHSPLWVKVDNSLQATLHAIVNLKPRIIKRVGEIRTLKYKNNRTGAITTKNRSTSDLIKEQLRLWCNELGSEHAREIAKELFALEIDYAKTSATCTPGLTLFLEFLEKTILNQVKALMTRYEERFVTLPTDILPPKHQNKLATSERDPNNLDTEEKCLISFSNHGSGDVCQQVVETVSDGVKCNFLEKHMTASRDTAEILAFWRHEESSSPRTIKDGESNKRKTIDLLYREPLSGSQSYLNSFETFYDGNSTEIQRKRFVSKLLETGLMKILLIDERVKKFEREHSDVKATFADIGISTLDDESTETGELFNGEKCDKHPIEIKIGTFSLSDFDIVVIHQGIIDKKLEDHNNPQKIRKFIEYLKSEIRYVVVTTGRGNPANIPNDVRLLPFSVLESTLFKKYPEKLILVDAIMNLLPSGGKE